MPLSYLFYKQQHIELLKKFLKLHNYVFTESPFLIKMGSIHVLITSLILLSRQSSCLQHHTISLLFQSSRPVDHENSVCNGKALFSGYYNIYKMFPVKALTTWPKSCSTEIASCVLLRSFPTCFHKICRGPPYYRGLNSASSCNNL